MEIDFQVEKNMLLVELEVINQPDKQLSREVSGLSPPVDIAQLLLQCRECQNL